jgi:hypothetical protein
MNSVFVYQQKLKATNNESVNVINLQRKFASSFPAIVTGK